MSLLLHPQNAASIVFQKKEKPCKNKNAKIWMGSHMCADANPAILQHSKSKNMPMQNSAMWILRNEKKNEV